MESDKSYIINTAMAHIGGQAENFEEFSDMIKALGKPVEVDHSANMALLNGGLS